MTKRRPSGKTTVPANAAPCFIGECDVQLPAVTPGAEDRKAGLACSALGGVGLLLCALVCWHPARSVVAKVAMIAGSCVDIVWIRVFLVANVRLFLPAGRLLLARI